MITMIVVTNAYTCLSLRYHHHHHHYNLAWQSSPPSAQ